MRRLRSLREPALLARDASGLRFRSKWVIQPPMQALKRKREDVKAPSTFPEFERVRSRGRSLRGAGSLLLAPERIQWRTSGSEVEILIDVVNPASVPTEPATLVIEAAPLGAFVRWRPLARIPVGALAPGANVRVAHIVARAKLPPFDLFRTAMGGGFGPNFPPEGMGLSTTAEWAGNLNVWFDNAREEAVEVHRALNLNVAAGRRAVVGVFAPERESGFDAAVECMGAGWTAELVYEPGLPVAYVVVGTPVEGRRAVVNLWVTRRSDERRVLVELRFRSVDGPTEQLGCVRV